MGSLSWLGFDDLKAIVEYHVILFSPLTPINVFNESDLPTKSLYNSNDNAIFFQNGEEQAFAWFFRQLYPSLTLYCFKITGDKEASEEIASNAFIKIWEKHERFNDADSIKAYLYRIVRNDALKYLHKEKQELASNKEVVYLYGNQNEKDHFNTLVTAEISREILNAINALPAECSKVFRLMYIEGKSIKETAEALQLSPSTIKTQKKRGIEALRKSLHLSIIVIVAVFNLLRLFIAY